MHRVRKSGILFVPGRRRNGAHGLDNWLEARLKLPALELVLDKIIEEALIVDQQRVLGQIFRLRLHSPAIVNAARPGQFVMMRVREGRRPFAAPPFFL